MANSVRKDTFFAAVICINKQSVVNKLVHFDISSDRLEINQQQEITCHNFRSCYSLKNYPQGNEDRVIIGGFQSIVLYSFTNNKFQKISEFHSVHSGPITDLCSLDHRIISVSPKDPSIRTVYLPDYPCKASEKQDFISNIDIKLSPEFDGVEQRRIKLREKKYSRLEVSKDERYFFLGTEGGIVRVENNAEKNEIRMANDKPPGYFQLNGNNLLCTVRVSNELIVLDIELNERHCEPGSQEDKDGGKVVNKFRSVATKDNFIWYKGGNNSVIWKGEDSRPQVLEDFHVNSNDGNVGLPKLSICTAGADKAVSINSCKETTFLNYYERCVGSVTAKTSLFSLNPQCLEMATNEKHVIVGGGDPKKSKGVLALLELDSSAKVVASLDMLPDKEQSLNIHDYTNAIHLIMRCDQQDNFIAASHEFIFVVKIVGLEMENRYRVRHLHSGHTLLIDMVVLNNKIFTIADGDPHLCELRFL